MHRQTHYSIALLLLGHTAGLPNLWHAAFTAVRICLFLLPDQLLCIVKNMCVYTCILHCIEIVYELTLLPNNIACETFLHKHTDIRRAFCILITGPAASLAVTRRIHDIGQNILQSSFQTGSSSSLSYCHIFFLISLVEEALIRNIINIL